LLSCLFLSLVHYPHVQKRAQAELDLVVGRDRLPTFDDRPRLPYIEAICRELVRWQMVTPIGAIFPYLLSKLELESYLPGIPHASTEDDVYRGFFIPKGLFVLMGHRVLQ
jgi:cytochrome P450